MTDMTPAARAREAALSVEAKKHALRQQQDGCWIMTLRVHQNDMPEAIMKAAMGTRYQLAMVEIGDDELPVDHPIIRPAKPPVTTFTEQPVSHSVSPGTSEERPEPVRPPDSVPAEPARADKERRSFGELKPATQAGIICGERAFRLFLAEQHPEVWTITNRDPAACVREICKVDSRADIQPDNAIWSALVLAYRLWLNHPEYAA